MPRFATLPPNDYSLITKTNTPDGFLVASQLDIVAQPQGHHDEHQIDTARNHRDFGNHAVASACIRRYAADDCCAGSAT
ncbi:MAG: hypothetical protein ACTHM2_00570 [Afipia sp.]|jgi:hypothetical protein